MGGWRPLPDGLPPEVRHFVTQLRELKDRTGLSLATLGARTAYSKSSWQRYLNAVQPPPPQAVTALCRVAGLSEQEAERVAVRREMAVEAWPRPEPEVPVPVPEGGEPYDDDPTVPWWERWEEPAPRPPGRLLLVALVLLCALLLTVVAGVLLAA